MNLIGGINGGFFRMVPEAAAQCRGEEADGKSRRVSRVPAPSGDECTHVTSVTSAPRQPVLPVH